MNLLDLFLIIILVIIFSAAIRFIVVNRRKGNLCSSCGTGCSSCAGGCASCHSKFDPRDSSDRSGSGSDSCPGRSVSGSGPVVSSEK